MHQVEDQEMKVFVVRSNVGNKPEWLKLNVMGDVRGRYDTTDDERIAWRFADFDDAQSVADGWSDVPGVWRVERM